MKSRPRARSYGTVVRSEGQRMLLHVTGSMQAIATEVSARSQTSVADWRSGKRVPSVEARARIQEAFGIPIEAWSHAPTTDDPAAVEAPATPPPLADPHAPIPSSLEACLSLLSQIQRDRVVPNLLPAERVKLADAEARILKLRAELERQAEFSEDRYVRDHPAWLKVRREIAHALQSFPEAARAVADALERMEF